MIQQVNRMDFFCTTKQFLELDAHDDFEAKSKILKKNAIAAARAAALPPQSKKVERGTKHNLCKEYHDGKIMRSF